MKSLKSILESILIKPTKIKETSSYKEIWYQNLGVRFKAEYQQLLINGYLSTVERNSWDDSDKKREIKIWQNNSMEFDALSAYVKQFGNDNPIISITISASNPNDKWNTFRNVISYITVPNPDKKEFTTDELIEFGDAVIDKLHSKTNKVIKYMAKHWNLPNEYTNYEEFMKI